jgi:hypothetical protein
MKMSSEPDKRVVPFSGGYLQYQSTRRQSVLSTATKSSTDTELPQDVIKLIDSYISLDMNDNLKNLTSRLSQSKSPLETVMHFANEAYHHTLALLPYGQGNITQTINELNGYTYVASNEIRQSLKTLLKPDKDKYTDLYKALHTAIKLSDKTFDDAQVEALVRPILATLYGTGRCHEYAMTTLQCLFQLQAHTGEKFTNAIKGIELCQCVVTSPKNDTSTKATQHIYAAIIAKNDTRIICDAWNDMIGPENICKQRQGLAFHGDDYRQSSGLYLSQNAIKEIQRSPQFGIDVFQMLNAIINNKKTNNPLADSLITAISAQVKSYEVICKIAEKLKGGYESIYDAVPLSTRENSRCTIEDMTTTQTKAKEYDSSEEDSDEDNDNDSANSSTKLVSPTTSL